MALRLGNAISQLVNAGLIVGTIVPVASATVPEGRIVSQSIAGGSVVPLNTLVNLVFSSGPPVVPANVTVPNVVGLNQLAALEAIGAAGLTYGYHSTTYVNNVAAANTVLSQVPAAAASVAPSTQINLTISLGPAAIPVTVIVPTTN